MMIVVRPRMTSRSPCLICASVVASTDAVASSRMSTRGSTINARAIAARGTHEELVAKSPVYRDIYEHGLLEREFASRVEERATA